MVDVTNHPNWLGFELSVIARPDGSLEAAYLKFRDEPVAQTREIIESVLLADYSADGELVGIEVLGPVRIADIEALVDQSRRPGVRSFLDKSAPKGLIAA